MIDSGLGQLAQRIWRGAARAEDAQGTPTPSHISPSILVSEDKPTLLSPAEKSTLGPLNLNQRYFKNILFTFGDKCPSNGSKTAHGITLEGSFMVSLNGSSSLLLFSLELSDTQSL